MQICPTTGFPHHQTVASGKYVPFCLQYFFFSQKRFSRYIDSPASDTNPPNYASDSFVINFNNLDSNHTHGIRGTNRPSLTESLRLEHSHDVHTPNSRINADTTEGGDDSRAFPNEQNENSAEISTPPHNHEHNESNLSETIAQIPEAASLLDTLSRYVPYVCILLAKGCYDNLDGILDFFALFVTFYHGNKVVCIFKENRREPSTSNFHYTLGSTRSY